MDRERLRLFGERIKIFLLSKNSREVMVFLIFFGISAGFWLLQTLHEDYETEIQVSLRLTNIPRDVVITTDLPPTLSVTVKERGSTLLGYLFDADKLNVEIDFNAHDRGVNFDHILLSHSEVQKTVLRLLQPSTRILSIRPDTLDYYYTRGVERRVPIVFNGHVGTDPYHYLAQIHLEPDSVTIWGNHLLLDSLQCLYTTETNISDIAETTALTVPIAPIRGTKIVPAEVKLIAEVDFYMENNVEVPIVGTNFPAGYSLRTFPSTANISFRVGSRDYKKITKDNFVLTTTYEELMALNDSTLTLQLRSVPEGASQIKITPEKVDFLIEQTGIDIE